VIYAEHFCTKSWTGYRAWRKVVNTAMLHRVCNDDDQLRLLTDHQTTPLCYMLNAQKQRVKLQKSENSYVKVIRRQCTSTGI